MTCDPLEQKYENHSVLTKFSNDMDQETIENYVSQFDKGDPNAHKWLHKMTYSEYLVLEERKSIDENFLTPAEKETFLLKSELLAR